MSTVIDIVVGLLLLSGAFFTLVGSFGLVRFGDFYARLHGPTKATTLGVGSLLIAAVIHFAANGEGLRLHKVLIALFLFLTAPVGAHLVARAGLHTKANAGAAGEAPDDPQTARTPTEGA